MCRLVIGRRKILSACQPPPQPPAWRLRRLLFVSQVCDLPHASIIFWRLAVAIAAAAAPLRVLLVHCMLFLVAGSGHSRQRHFRACYIQWSLLQLSDTKLPQHACHAAHSEQSNYAIIHTHIAEVSSGSSAHNQWRNRSLFTWF